MITKMNRPTQLSNLLCTGAAILALAACAESTSPNSVGPGRFAMNRTGGPLSPNAQGGFENYTCLTFRAAAESMIQADRASAEATYQTNKDVNTQTMDAILKELETDEATSAKIRKFSKKIKKSGNAKVASDPIARRELLMVRDALARIAGQAFGKIKDKSGKTLVSCTTSSTIEADDDEDAPLTQPAPTAVKSAAIAGVTDFEITCNTGSASNPRVNFVAYDKQANAALLGISYAGREESKIRMADHRFEVETPATVWYRFKKKSGYSVPVAKDGRDSRLPTYILHDLDTMKSYSWTQSQQAQFNRDVENVVAPAGCNK